MTHAPAGRVTPLRHEIQALRALAVTGVVLVHLWPRVLPGGQVGVDVFFVVSGFLITGMLLREATKDGRISLPRFYVRRAKRLLPSALLVLGVSAIVTAVFVPRALLGDFVREILASTFYVQNWLLGSHPRTHEDTPLTHFWSLSVEEQFYLVWPLLVIVGVLIARRAGLSLRWTLVVLLGAITIASFVYNIWQTGADFRLAYFSTLSRAWEFGVGGLLALVPASRIVMPRAVRGVMSWAGLAVIVVAMVLASDPEIFPGWVAVVPVAGALAVIVAGTELQPRWGTRALAELAPVQWVGSISYSIYLWHWPVVAFAPFITGEPSEWWFLVVLLGVVVLLAWGTTRLLEDRVRGIRSVHAGRDRIVVASPR